MNNTKDKRKEQGNTNQHHQQEQGSQEQPTNPIDPQNRQNDPKYMQEQEKGQHDKQPTR